MLTILPRLREPAEADLATLPVAAHDGSGSEGSAFGRPMRSSLAVFTHAHTSLEDHHAPR